MKGVCLKLYTYEQQKHQGILLYEWLIEEAKKNEIEGGAIFRAVAGYGRHGILHEEHFFELASNVPIEVHFITARQKATTFLQRIQNQNLHLMYSISETEYGFLNENSKITCTQKLLQLFKKF